MINKIINSMYASLLIMSSERKNFTSMGNIINKSGYEISKSLNHFEEMLLHLETLAKNIFAKDKKLVLAIDETFIKKPFSKNIIGTGDFYCLKIGKKLRGFKTVCAVLTNGKTTLPVNLDILFDKNAVGPETPNLIDIAVKIISHVKKIFKDKKITVTLDGSYSTSKFLKWAYENKISLVARMHSNRTVKLKKNSKEKISISILKSLQLKGRRKNRTVFVYWYNIPLYVTSHKRIDKNGNESVVYLVSTFKNKPSHYIELYKKRWNIEKMFRTIKQKLGLQDCQSTNLKIQLNHIGEVLHTYALLQIEMKKNRLKTPEEALRRLKTKKTPSLKHHLAFINQNFGGLYA